MTIRRRIADLLAERPHTLRDLSVALGIRERDVLDHLPHVARSVPSPKRLRVSPAQCLQCGFLFRKRERFSTPGKCPCCRSQRIHPPDFAIEG
jgi:transcriptional regulator